MENPDWLVRTEGSREGEDKRNKVGERSVLNDGSDLGGIN